jgi:thiamine-phosphate pyrophosphorylase
LKLGISTHNLRQLELALDERPDYVAFGPVFTTHSKARPDPVVGTMGLASAAAAAAARGCRLVAIGGITLDNASDVAACGATGAVIGGLLPPDGDLDGVEERALSLHRALGGDG